MPEKSYHICLSYTPNVCEGQCKIESKNELKKCWYNDVYGATIWEKRIVVTD